MKKNVISFPNMETGDNLSSFDFADIDSTTMNKVFDVMDMLSNHEELLEKFKPSVLNFLSNEAVFSNTSYKKMYDDAFSDYVIMLIKREIVDHFDYTPEEIMILTEKDFVDIITEGYFFNRDNYKVKEVENVRH